MPVVIQKKLLIIKATSRDTGGGDLEDVVESEFMTFFVWVYSRSTNDVMYCQ